jgi:hypothetical protein
MFLKDGSLRKTLGRTFATHLIYFEEHWKAVEMRDVQVCARAHTQAHTHTSTHTHTHTHSSL